jgi:hypothetical protein
MYESERLARTLFSAMNNGQQAQTLPLIHPDAVIAPSYDPSTVVSRAELLEHVETGTMRVFDSVGQKYTPLDDERIIVEGRARVRLKPECFAAGRWCG